MLILYGRFWIGLHIHKKEMHAPAVGISKDTNNIAQTSDAPLENLKKTDFFLCVCVSFVMQESQTKKQENPFDSK